MPRTDSNCSLGSVPFSFSGLKLYLYCNVIINLEDSINVETSNRVLVGARNKKESITYFDTLRSTKFQIYLLVFIV